MCSSDLIVSAYANVAFAFPDGDDGEPTDLGSDVMLRRIAFEWECLHNCGIVPQPVSREWRKYL